MKTLLTLSLTALVAMQLQGCGNDRDNNRNQGANGQNNQSALSVPMGASTLNDLQRYTLAYMWNEEKLAKDIYLALNALTPHQTLENIATRSESKHQEQVEALIAAYDLNILNLTDYSGGYDATALAAYNSGLYSIDEVSDLYGALYAKGSASLQDALEVGCMVEVTDINDLNKDLITAEGADDLVAVFENLRSGSYNHYWAFDSALKGIGVSEGCCVLGSDYCKTADEYPQNDKGAKNSAQNRGPSQGKK
ncbi:MAG: DUF2202 domain-containing protein [Campylobacterales bacterium]|nr:DUF2202 domain-containing protein [Campylobacterales bacterium]